jgi:mono/diheme cytochrome c family protein
MALSFQTTAYGTVAVVAVVLFSIGTPAERFSQAPVTVTPISHAAPPTVGVSGNGITLQSVSVEFPSSDRSFPGGAAAQVIMDNCTACHSPGMVLNQPALTPAHWQAEVEHMRANFKAPVADADVPAIVAYLAATKGAR